LGSRFNLPLPLIATGLVPLLLLFLLHRHKKPVILASLCLFALFGGAGRFQSSLPAVNEGSLQFYNDRGVVEIRGMVSADPDARDKSVRLRLQAAGIKWGEVEREISGTVLILVPRYPAYGYGDLLRVTGELETPPRLDGFDYREYLAHQGIYSTMLYPEIEVLAGGSGFKPLEWVYSLRGRLSQTLAEVLPEPQAALAQGIVLGIRGNIPPSLQENFSQTGTAHLLAISGLHLSIMAGVLVSLGIWLLGRRRCLYVWLALGTIWLYALITGMHLPVVRAAIMVSLFLSAELLGRQRSVLPALALAAAVMVGVSPRVLWDASFHMSFLAMTGLIFVFPRLQTVGRKGVKVTLGEDGAVASMANVVTDGFSVTLGAIIATWPVIAYYFGIVSFVGPVATFLALPVLPGIIITGVLAGGLGLIALPVAQAVGWLAWLFLSYLLFVVRGFAALPLSSVEVGSVSAVVIWAYYPALAIVLWLSSHWRKLARAVPRGTAGLELGVSRLLDSVSRLPRKWVIPPLLVVAILVSLTAVTLPDDNLHVSFLDVGQGDAILIQTPSHQDILVDGGASPQTVLVNLSQKMPFWDRTIDLVILTHPHNDHITGLIEVLKRYRVKQVLYPDLDYDSPAYEEWLALVEQKGIGSTIARTGQQIDLGEGTEIRVLNPQVPPLTGTQSDTDNNGVVLRLSLGEVSFLLTADIMLEAEFELIRRRTVSRCTVLKVAHHGSDTSTTAGFLAVAGPQLAVISVGADNRFAHPSDEVLARLKGRVDSGNIYRTDERGTIEFITDGRRLWMSSQKAR